MFCFPMKSKCLENINSRSKTEKVSKTVFKENIFLLVLHWLDFFFIPKFSFMFNNGGGT